MSQYSPCSGPTCNATILWVPSAKPPHKAVPLDPDPTDEGNVIIMDGFAQVVKPSDCGPYAGQLYMPHHATCPDVARFRAAREVPAHAAERR